MTDTSDVIIVAIFVFLAGIFSGHWISRTATVENCQIQHEFRVDTKVYDCSERTL